MAQPHAPAQPHADAQALSPRSPTVAAAATAHVPPVVPTLSDADRELLRTKKIAVFGSFQVGAGRGSGVHSARRCIRACQWLAAATAHACSSPPSPLLPQYVVDFLKVRAMQWDGGQG